MPIVRHEINLNNFERTFVGSNTRHLAKLDTDKFDGTVTYYFEAVGSVTTGTLTIALRRNGTTTDDATFTFTETSPTRKRTSFTPPAGITDYAVFHDATGTTGPRNIRARIIVIQNSSSFTKTQSQFEISTNEQGVSVTSAAPQTNPQYFYYDSANWDGTVAFEASVTYAMQNSMYNGTIKLQEDDGSFGGWADKVTIVSAGSSTTYVIVTVSFTPTSGRNYRIVRNVNDAMGSLDIFNAKILVTQTASPTKFEEQYLVVSNVIPSATGLTNCDAYFDPAEWSSATVNYYHEGNSVASGTSDLKLQSDPNGTPADITGSTITDCVERERTGTLTMPGAATEIDTNITSNPSGIHASRIIVVAVVTVAPPASLVLSRNDNALRFLPYRQWNDWTGRIH